MKLSHISEDLNVKDLNIFRPRPTSEKIYFYELPEAVQIAASKLIRYEDIAYIMKWLDGYFIMSKDHKEYGFKEDGSEWVADTEIDPEPAYTSSKR